MKVNVIQMPSFKKVYKKFTPNIKYFIDQAICQIIENPTIGEEKKGDLKGVFVYKFKIYNQETLLAYQWNPQDRLLLMLGSHENFYRDLKNNFMF